MISVGIDAKLESQLSNISRLLNISETDFIRDAIEYYIEDRLDYLDAIDILQKNEKMYSLDEVLYAFKDDLQN